MSAGVPSSIGVPMPFAMAGAARSGVLPGEKDSVLLSVGLEPPCSILSAGDRSKRTIRLIT